MSSYAIGSHVLPNIPKGKFPNHVYLESPLLMKLIAKNEKQDGGLSYDPNRIAVKNGNSVWFAGTSYSAIVTSTQAGVLKKASFPWSSAVTPVTLTWDEQLRAGSGEFVRVTAEEAKKAEAKYDHYQLLANGVVKASGSSGVLDAGIEQFLDPTATVGGVVPGTDTDYVSQSITDAVVLSGPSLLTDAIIPATKRSKVGDPDSIWAGQTMYIALENVLERQVHYLDKEDGEYNMGVQKFNWKGLPVYMDRYVSDGKILIPCLKVIHLYQSSLAFAEASPLVTPTAGTDQHGSKVGTIKSAFILAMDERWNQTGLLSVTVA